VTVRSRFTHAGSKTILQQKQNIKSKCRWRNSEVHKQSQTRQFSRCYYVIDLLHCYSFYHRHGHSLSDFISSTKLSDHVGPA